MDVLYLSPLVKKRSRCNGTYISSPQRLRERSKAVKIPFEFNINNNNNDDDEIKEKKRMMNKRRGTRDKVDDDIDSSTSLTDDDNLVCEILSRLLAKSLKRFKCVCKSWWSLIEQDSHLHHLQLKRATKTRTGLLMITQLMRQNKLKMDLFLSADLFFEGRTAEVAFHTVRKINYWFYDKCMKPVNGLICFIYFILVPVVCICNISTREATPWIESALLKKEKQEHNGVKEVDGVPNFGFGFDPATKEHKMICVWKITRSPLVRKSRKRALHRCKSKSNEVILACEILTVGENLWRRIDEVPLYDLKGDSIYANGSIYWTNYNCLKKEKSDNEDPEVIVAFDVGREKFRVIPIPNFILDQARNGGGKFDPSLPLLEFDGHVALLSGNFGMTVKVWILDDDFDRMQDNGTSSSNINWTEDTIILPRSWGHDMCLHFHVVEGTDLIILAYDMCVSITRKFVDLYFYNQKTKTSKEARISGIKLFPLPMVTSLFTTFVESIFPVQKKPQQNLKSE